MACKKCTNGLIPHPKINHAWLDCECKHDERESYRNISPDMFDFPCSSTWRGYYFESCGLNDPGRIPVTQTDYGDRLNNLEAISAEPGRIPQTYERKLDQIQGRVLYLQGKVNDLTLKKLNKENASAF